MAPLRRELLWAATVAAQLLALAVLFPIGSFLQESGWVGSIGDLVLLPLLLCLVLLPSILSSLALVWLWLLLCRARRRAPGAVGLAHFVGTLAGAFGMFVLVGRVGPGEPEPALVSLVWATPIALMAFVLLQWPRYAFPALRVGGRETSTPASPAAPRS